MKAIFSSLVSAFATGALTWGATHLTDSVPSNGAQWSALGLGMLLGGAIAVVHLYQPVPS